MAIMFPSGLGMSAMLAWKRTLPSCSALKAANSAPPGPSLPPPRNQGSTMSVNVAEGTSPSRICLACGQSVMRESDSFYAACHVVPAHAAAGHAAADERYGRRRGGARRQPSRRAALQRAQCEHPCTVFFTLLSLQMVHHCAAKSY